MRAFPPRWRSFPLRAGTDHSTATSTSRAWQVFSSTRARRSSSHVGTATSSATRDGEKRRTTMSATFQVPSVVLFGAGASQELPAQVKRLQATRVLLVTDRFFVQNGLEERLVHALYEAGIETGIF